MLFHLMASSIAVGEAGASKNIFTALYIFYPGAHHHFDFQEGPSYHPQAAAAAWEEVRRFLKATK